MIRKAHTSDRPANHPDAPPDELANLKQRLLEAQPDVGFNWIRRHPKTAAALAFALGATVGSVPFARRTAFLAASWSARRLIRRYLTQKPRA